MDDPIVLDTFEVNGGSQFDIGINDSIVKNLDGDNGGNIFDVDGDGYQEYNGSETATGSWAEREAKAILEGLNKFGDNWKQSGPYTFTNDRTGQTYDSRTGKVTSPSSGDGSADVTKSVTSSSNGGGGFPNLTPSKSGESSSLGTQIAKALETVGSLLNTYTAVKTAIDPSKDAYNNAAKAAQDAAKSQSGISINGNNLGNIAIVGFSLIIGALVVKKLTK